MEFLDDDNFVALFPNEIECIRKLVEYGVFHKHVACPSCNGQMELHLSDAKKVFRCPRLACDHRELSYRHGSLFLGSMLKTRDIMRIARCWLKGESRNMAVSSTSLNPKTITIWYSAFRELVSCDLRNNNVQIGGAGIIVEVDETLLGRRKFNRGHHVEGAWVVVGIERTPQRRAFCSVVERRDASHLQSVIQKNVCRGSIVYTDEWRGYIGIRESCEVEHRTVNHSRHFKDPVTGICTNTVEGLNRALKSTVPPQNRNNRFAQQFLDQFIWKRLFKNTLCQSFIEMLSRSLLDN